MQGFFGLEVEHQSFVFHSGQAVTTPYAVSGGNTVFEAKSRTLFDGEFSYED